MARSSRPKPIKLKKPLDPEARRRRRKAVIHSSAIFVLLASISVGFYFLRGYVDRKLIFPKAPPRIVLKNRPAWMSDFLAGEIAKLARPAGAHSAFDHQMLVDTYTILKTNPWIRSIKQVRRVYGQQPADTLEVDCDYRAPVALVRWGDFFWLVDGDGVKLPEAYTPAEVPKIVVGQDKKLAIRIIEGVKQPPAEPGLKWQGADLAAGIEMVKVLFDKPYAQEIVKVDVTNFGGRKDAKEAQLVLITKHATAVRWGRPISADDFVVEAPSSIKLKYLQAIYEEVGRVDGNHPWIDIRFADDSVTYPSVEAAQADYRR
ncbi:MAG TPA: hypothetical protein VF669_11955 [Tepidisphaeraceae bacterium]|jgi:hypothetical protein